MKIGIDKSYPTYSKSITEAIAKMGEAQGFSCGGRWDVPDYPHFQMTFGQSIGTLFKNYKYDE